LDRPDNAKIFRTKGQNLQISEEAARNKAQFMLTMLPGVTILLR